MLLPSTFVLGAPVRVRLPPRHQQLLRDNLLLEHALGRDSKPVQPNRAVLELASAVKEPHSKSAANLLYHHFHGGAFL